MKQTFKIRAVTGHLVMLALVTMTLLAKPLVAFAQPGEIKIFDSLPPGQSGTKKPTDKDLLFYIQRSMNRNTVVYVARRDPSGKLAKKKPIDVYWRRFSSDGKRSRLTYIERTMAFGVVTKNSGSHNGEFKANLVSYPAKKATLKLDKTNKPVILTTLGNHKVRLIFAFIQLKGSDVIPKIVYVDVVGQDVSSGRYVRRRVYASKNNQPRQYSR